jgi:pimeloyl-ACP methyl ester carboxylesterase
MFALQQLDPCSNGRWFAYNDSDTVFVFVHGIGSDSRSAWFHRNPQDRQKEAYWPDLVRTDPRFGSPSIFLGGFYTEIASGIYDIRAAADELLEALKAQSPDGKRSALEKANIVFVAHSTGGIVVRHMLSRTWNSHLFKDKAIGLVLVASPSIGSKDANTVNFIDRIVTALGITVQNKMLEQLKWYNSFLVELDKDFKAMTRRDVLPFMTGVELIENSFILNWVRAAQIVQPESAARYFEGQLVGGTNHLTIAKPAGLGGSSAHTKLLDFVNGTFKTRIQAARSARPPLKAILMDSYARIYERNPVPGEMNAHVIRRVLAGLPVDASDIEPVYVNWNGDESIAERHVDLILIHYSSLDTGQIRGETASARLGRFLQLVLEKTTKTQVIVYSRVDERAKGFDLGARVRSLLPDRVKHLSHRLHGFPVFKHGSPNHSFNNQRVAGDLRNLVIRVLNLPN